MKHELRHMLPFSHGAIVNIASAAGIVGAPGFGGYVAAKHGQVGLTKTAALGYGAQGIRVNAIAAGLVDTPLIGEGRSPEVMAARVADHAPLDGSGGRRRSRTPSSGCARSGRASSPAASSRGRRVCRPLTGPLESATIHHVALSVGDLDAMVSFYSALGFDEVGRANFAPAPDATSGYAADMATVCSRMEGPSQVTIGRPGEEPRELLELAPTAGDSAEVDMRMTMTSTASIDGQESPSTPLPSRSLGLALTVGDVTDDEVTMTVGYDRVEIEGGDPALQPVLDSTVGITGTITTSRRGAFIDGEADTSGVDPRWPPPWTSSRSNWPTSRCRCLPSRSAWAPPGRSSRAVDSQGVTFCNRVAYQLTACDGDAYVLEVAMTQATLPGIVVQAGGTAEVLEGSGSGTGTSSGRLSFPAAVSGKTTNVTHLAMAVDDGSTPPTPRTTPARPTRSPSSYDCTHP